MWLDLTFGLRVYNLRLKFRNDKLTTEQIAEFETIRVRLAPPNRDLRPKGPTAAERREKGLLRRLELLKPRYGEHGSINVKQHDGVNGWTAPSRWITYLRTQRSRDAIPPSVIRAADEINIVWNPAPGYRGP